MVIWYDPSGEWAEDFDNYQPKAAEKLRVEGNEFSVKVAISRAALDQRFLLYLPISKPLEPDNWLLDLLLAGHEFKADRASLDIQEAGLTLEFKELALQHKAFFSLLYVLASLRICCVPTTTMPPFASRCLPCWPSSNPILTSCCSMYLRN